MCKFHYLTTLSYLNWLCNVKVNGKTVLHFGTAGIQEGLIMF